MSSLNRDRRDVTEFAPWLPYSQSFFHEKYNF